MQTLINLLLICFTLLLPTLEAKSVTITTFDELRAIKEWSNLTITLKTAAGTVWRLDQRHVIRIKNAKEFVLDGGSHPPTIYGHGFTFKNCKDATIRNMVVRPGSVGFDQSNLTPALLLESCKNINVEHCSFTWGIDTLVHIDDSDNVTFNYCILAETAGYTCKVEDSANVNIKNCLFARGFRGNPALISNGNGKPDLTMQSCVVFDYSIYGSEYQGNKDDVGLVRYQFYDNYYIPSAHSGNALYVDRVGTGNRLKLGISDNQYDSGDFVLPSLNTNINVQTTVQNKSNPKNSIDKILKHVGPEKGHRTATDQRIIKMVTDRQFQAPWTLESSDF